MIPIFSIDSEERKLIIYISTFYFFYEVLLFVKNIILFNFDYDIGSSLNPIVTWPIYLIDWFVVTTYMIIISKVFKKKINRLFRLRYLIIHFLFSLLLGLLIFATIYYALIVSRQIQIQNFGIKEALLRTLSFVDANFLVYFSLLGLIYCFYYFKNIEEIQTKQSQLSNRFLITKMALLKAQINPHFIFNALNNVSALIYIDQERAQKTIANLSDILRNTLENKDKGLISLNEELESLEKYLNIIKTRFQEDLIINLIVSQEVRSCKIPSFLIQPIIENAIKHGYSKRIKELSIKVKIFKRNKALVIEIHNNGEPLKLSQNKLIQKGIGLKNIIERLRLIYKNKFIFQIQNLENKKGVLLLLEIPFND